MKESPSPTVHKLIETLPFESLTQKDKDLVLSEMSQEEYQAYHTLISQTKVIAAPAKLNPHSLNNIKNKLGDQLISEKTTLEKISSARMPVWLAASCFLVGCGLVQLLQGNSSATEPAITPEPITITVVDTIVQHQIDTIYKEIISEPQIITREVIQYVEIASTPQEKPSDITASEIPEDQKAYYADFETSDFIPQRTGQSVEKESELMEFLNINETSANNFNLSSGVDK